MVCIKTAKLKSAKFFYVCMYVWRYRTIPPNLIPIMVSFWAKLPNLMTANISGYTVYETSDMQGHGLGRLGYRNESKSTTNASFATGCCTILKWLTLAVLITHGRGSISSSPPGAGGVSGQPGNN